MHCTIALRNIATGALVGRLTVPDWDPNNDEDLKRDLVAETFGACNLAMSTGIQAADGSCGLFHWGPLTGLWEWLDFGEEPVDRDEKWATSVLHAIQADQ